MLGGKTKIGKEMDLRCPSMESFAQVAEAGVSSPQFTALCSWLVSELRALCPLEEDVNPTLGPEDAETFQIEVSGLLSELHCPYPSLTTGDVTARLCTPDRCLQLLYFLSSELLAARLQARKQPRVPEEGDRGCEAVRELQRICHALGMPPPDLGCPIRQLLADIQSKVPLGRDRHALFTLLPALKAPLSLDPRLGGALWGGQANELLRRKISEVLSAPACKNQQMAPLLKVPLCSEEWKALEGIQGVLRAEYQCRKRMMLTRFDVTVESFHWSERAKDRSMAMSEAFRPLRQPLLEDSQVTPAHLLAAREDFSRIVKTSSGTLRDKTSCAVNKVLMGSVPDRGGRPNEIEPPMPTWEKRREGGGSGGHQRWGKRSKKKKK